jgi:hypothetical protein
MFVHADNYGENNSPSTIVYLSATEMSILKY